jgi:hypothetical protein
MSKHKLSLTTCSLVLALSPAVAFADGPVGSTSPPEAPRSFEPSAAPDYEPPDQVLLPGHVEHGGFGAPEIKLTTMMGDAAILVGGQGGWIINHGFVLGGAGYGLATQHDAPASLSRANTRSTLQFGYGGPRLVYIYQPHALVHLTFGLLVGGGGYSVLSRNDGANTSNVHDGRGFFVAEPQAEVEANIVKFVRVGFGLSYRYVGIGSTAALGSTDLSGPAGSLFAKLGWF